ncbi:hypothetical protein CCP1ISM_100012 [Azospirillaceae bacterium]
MVVLITTLLEIKSKLSGLGLDYSDNRFSREMLSKSSRYMSWLRSTNHEPALDSMVSLYTKLDDLCNRYERSGNQATANQIDGMADALWDAIRRASLAQGPNRRVTADHRKTRQDVAPPTGAAG